MIKSDMVKLKEDLGEKYNYIWDYLIPEYNDREKKLEGIVLPYLKMNETVLDLACGFSPLTDIFTKKYHNRVIGYDVNEKSILYCKHKYDPKFTHFYTVDENEFSTTSNIDVHLHLGISPSADPHEPANDIGTSLKFIISKKPRLLILESASHYSSGLKKLVDSVTKLGIYQLETFTTYKISFLKSQKSVNPDFRHALHREIYILSLIPHKSIFSLNDNLLTEILLYTNPSSQSESFANLNLGFGFLYYTLARILRPKLSLVFGSTKGFSPICFGLGIMDNHNDGEIMFVDAGYSDSIDGKDKGCGGVGFWKNESIVKKSLKRFHLENIIHPFIMKTSDFARSFIKRGAPKVDLLFIDADHTYNGFKYDFETFSKFMSDDGLIVFHDPLVEKGFYGIDFGVKKYFEENLSQNFKFESSRLPVWPGIAFVKRKTFISPLEEKYNKIFNSKFWKFYTLTKKIIYFPITSFFSRFTFLNNHRTVSPGNPKTGNNN
jgi:hypothetical protein